MSMSRQEIIHRRAVVAAALLIGFTVAAVALARLTGGGDLYVPAGNPVATAELNFVDEPDGVVAVFDARTGTRLIDYGENEGVFVRSVMRGVARQRRMRGQGPQMPVTLSRLDDGKLWLIDPASGTQIYLGAFGPDNTGAFTEILERGEQVLTASAEGDAR